MGPDLGDGDVGSIGPCWSLFCSWIIARAASSTDGVQWTPDAGVRISAEQGGAGELGRVSSPEVTVATQPYFQLRMYFACSAGAEQTSVIRSATSQDGLEWNTEPGVRLEAEGASFTACRVLWLDTQKMNPFYMRLHVTHEGVGIRSGLGGRRA